MLYALNLYGGELMCGVMRTFLFGSGSLSLSLSSESRTNAGCAISLIIYRIETTVANPLKRVKIVNDQDLVMIPTRTWMRNPTETSKCDRQPSYRYPPPTSGVPPCDGMSVRDTTRGPCRQHAPRSSSARGMLVKEQVN